MDAEEHGATCDLDVAVLKLKKGVLAEKWFGSHSIPFPVFTMKIFTAEID